GITGHTIRRPCDASGDAESLKVVVYSLVIVVRSSFVGVLQPLLCHLPHVLRALITAGCGKIFLNVALDARVLGPRNSALGSGDGDLRTIFGYPRYRLDALGRRIDRLNSGIVGGQGG